MGKVDEVLAEMQRERQRLTAELARVDRVIAALEERGPAMAVTASAAPAGARPYALLDLYEATLHYLSTVDTPKTSTEIAAALRAGGFKTRSKNFVNTVRVMLRRSDGRSTGISVTKDGKRWFVRQKS